MLMNCRIMLGDCFLTFAIQANHHFLPVFAAQSMKTIMSQAYSALPATQQCWHSAWMPMIHLLTIPLLLCYNGKMRSSGFLFVIIFSIFCRNIKPDSIRPLLHRYQWNYSNSFRAMTALRGGIGRCSISLDLPKGETPDRRSYKPGGKNSSSVYSALLDAAVRHLTIAGTKQAKRSDQAIRDTSAME